MLVAILAGDMPHGFRHKVIALLLGIFVTLGMGLSNVEASTMTLKMTTSSEIVSVMGEIGHKNCSDCQGTNSKTMACTAGCTASVPVVFGQVEISSATITHEVFPALDFRLTSRAYPPDPYPPRTSDIA